MISERPLLGRVDVQVDDGSSWRSVLPDSTGLSIRRGGSRSGLGVKTDVGLCTVALLNAEDPVDGGTLTPGQAMRVMANGTPAVEWGTVASYGFEGYAEETVPAEESYSESFEAYALYSSNPGGWTSADLTPIVVDYDAFVGGQAMDAGSSGGGTPRWDRLSRVVSGLTVGRSYTLSVRVIGSTGFGANAPVRVGVLSRGVSGGTATPASHVLVSYSFTATATSHTLLLEQYNDDGTSCRWDAITLTRNAYPSVVNNGQDGWQPINGSELASTTTQKYAGNRSLSISAAEAGAVQAFRYLDGLVIGDEYTVTAWFYASSVAARSASIYTSTTAYVTPVLLPNEVWTQRSYTFTATTTAVDLYIVSGSTGLIYMDAVTVTRRTPAVLGDEIFTGTIVDIAAAYPLDKETGETRSVVQVTVSDAVRVHATTPRYGVTLSTPFFETFEDRIARLALSSQTPVEVPVNDAPREVYAF